MTMGWKPTLFSKYCDGIGHIIQQIYQLAKGTVASGHRGIVQHGMQHGNSGRPAVTTENMTESTYLIDEGLGASDRILYVSNSFSS